MSIFDVRRQWRAAVFIEKTQEFSVGDRKADRYSPRSDYFLNSELRAFSKSYAGPATERFAGFDHADSNSAVRGMLLMRAPRRVQNQDLNASAGGFVSHQGRWYDSGLVQCEQIGRTK